MVNEGRNAWSLDQNWEFKESSNSAVGGKWLAVAQFPTNIHLDLLKHGKIPDPYIDKNELLVEWIGEKSWSYKTTFPTPSLDYGASLRFDGLDTFATVILNRHTILESDNMFVSHLVDVTEHLAEKGETNELVIHFDSALLRARKIKDQYPGHKWIAYNGEIARLAVRKAQYHWSWDWGPFLMTCGPWRPIFLEPNTSAVVDLWLSNVEISQDGKQASVQINSEVKFGLEMTEKEAKVLLTISTTNPDVKVHESYTDITTSALSHTTLLIQNPDLWWPHGYGKQHLYTITARLVNGGAVLDTKTKKVGLRQIELIQEKDKFGQSFYFRFNGVDIYCGGSDWIPGDNFTPRMTAETYRDWLELMVHGNQQMIRVWGGGIYEEDVFYNLCDELGILVWQDFMFGCGNYPTFPAFLESIRTEALQNVKRLRHHPCLALYAGNNEDYMVAEQSGLTYDYEDKDPESWLKTDFPARYIYEKLLPDVIEELGCGVVYHPGSPWGGGKKTTDPTIGDMHQWNVWHGTQEKYQIYESLGGRFNSEFGMEAFPHIQTIEKFVTTELERYQQSSTMDFHNKASGHERRIATYMVENFRTVNNLEGYVHLSQLVQSEALAYGYRGWRRQWGSAGARRCGGALVWQLNDCWPTTSWAIVDYYLRKKPAYYTIARALRPLGVGIQREHWDWSVSHARPPKETKWEAWIVSSKIEAVKNARLEVRFISISTGKDMKPAMGKKGIEILPNGTTDHIFTGIVDNIGIEPHILSATLWIDGRVTARDVDWPQPLKYHSFEDRGLKVHWVLHHVDRTLSVEEKKKVKGLICVTCEKPLKGLVWEERTGVRVSDSAIDLVPGEEVFVDVWGLVHGDKELSWRYLGI